MILKKFILNGEKILDFFQKRSLFFHEELIKMEKGKVLFVCKSCGFPTLSKGFASYEICPICGWEDDIQDNHNADDKLGGPNSISLTESRLQIGSKLKYSYSREDIDKIFNLIEKYHSIRDINDYLYVLNGQINIDENFFGKLSLEKSTDFLHNIEKELFDSVV